MLFPLHPWECLSVGTSLVTLLRLRTVIFWPSEDPDTETFPAVNSACVCWSYPIVITFGLISWTFRQAWWLLYGNTNMTYIELCKIYLNLTYYSKVWESFPPYRLQSHRNPLLISLHAENCPAFSYFKWADSCLQ